jgi:hypothetical protein
VNQFALCAALMAAVGVVTQAQDRGPGSNLPATTAAAVSESERNQTPESASEANRPGPLCSPQRTSSGSQSLLPGVLRNPSSTTPVRGCRNEYDPLAHLRPIRRELTPDDISRSTEKEKRFQWSAAVQQSLVFLGVQHGYAMTQPKTRRDLKGRFFKDYFRSVKSLHGWEDGGRFFTNYLAHPLQGSFLGFIQIQNDPNAKSLRFGKSPAYWRSRMKALAWSAAWSTQFEIGPASQASIGNVGLHGKQTYVDLVMTPVGGLALLVAEDALDKNLVQLIERKWENFYVKIASRVLLNPTRSVANLLRFKKPWHRDQGQR